MLRLVSRVLFPWQAGINPEAPDHPCRQLDRYNRVAAPRGNGDLFRLYCPVAGVLGKNILLFAVAAELVLILFACRPSKAPQASEKAATRPESGNLGYWMDADTRLMWTTEDNGYDVNWNQAASFCRNLTTGGFRDWALPTIDQLTTIAEYKSAENNLGNPVKGDITLTSCCVWSATRDSEDSSRFLGFGFDYAGQASVLRDHTGTVVVRALCVRRAQQ